ncbi:Trp biosynthesis-associated membrane protein [Curtobacterium sp. MCLR17_036]|uniref:Trp biosynthesis-associated membrane protein n=1 Tax=Curtobacterium sp. MCLR17_036 TaxID=2175620 RepID=UPI000DA87BCF|nr:Trp biosynthesis-associated membrane protein [Curtobacterium sp. MCLR17_036]WIE63509.1 Trp biosynthesis-associated membrane protein [Curtobacterium sp. MCLR17_036]
MRRSRPIVVVAGLLVAGVVMLAWTQTWFTVHLHAGDAVTGTVDADGAAVVPSYTALAIASLALFLAMTIAGRVLRVVLALVEVLLGLGVVVSGVSALRDPVAAARGAIGQVAGVSDLGAVRRVVTEVDVTPWPVVGIVGGVLAMALGVVAVVVQRSWPGPSRKYGAATAGAAADARASAPVERDAVVDWDDLSAGVDPTTLDGTAAAAADDQGGTGGAVAGPVGDDTVGSTRRRSDDDAGAERGAP